jgi:lipopolysaccharide transport system ATP-binding protein
MSVAIRVENLSKSYLIRHQQHEPYVTLRDGLTNGAKGLWRKLRHPLRGSDSRDGGQEEFWALCDLSFEIRQGDRVGIIGRNGAGKSTLLKVLSRITEPTTGRLSMNGRVASLLEVGTGFHPELTGRENIFLNGAILGMSRAEIKRKFDEIVAFAEVERFLDTPVKRYSSGMYVRLAFAVAAHLEPEILVVDEVLAVGDAAFQKKCLGKMKEVGNDGRTVLFVSHNMNAIEQLCTSAILLDRGRLVVAANNPREVIHRYNSGIQDHSEPGRWMNPGSEFKSASFQPLRFSLTNALGEEIHAPVRCDEDVFVEIEGTVETPDVALQVGYAAYTVDGTLIYWTCHTDGPEVAWVPPNRGRHLYRSKLPSRLLNEGRYRLDLLCALYHRQWLNEPGVSGPSIYLDIAGGLSDSPYWMVRRPGLLAPVLDWAVFPSEILCADVFPGKDQEHQVQ